MAEVRHPLVILSSSLCMHAVYRPWWCLLCSKILGLSPFKFRCAAEGWKGVEDISLPSSRTLVGKQYGQIHVQQQTLVGQTVWTYQCPAAENLCGASSMDISMPSSITLVGQAVWTFQCPAADFWWGKQYGHFNVQQQTLVGQAVWTYQCPAA